MGAHQIWGIHCCQTGAEGLRRFIPILFKPQTSFIIEDGGIGPKEFFSRDTKKLFKPLLHANKN